MRHTSPPYLGLSLKYDGFVSAISCSAQHLVCKQFGMGRDLPVGGGIVAPCGWLSISIAIQFCSERLCYCAGTLILPPITASVAASTTRFHGPLTAAGEGLCELLFAPVCSVFLRSTGCNSGLDYYFPCFLVKVVRKKKLLKGN